MSGKVNKALRDLQRKNAPRQVQSGTVAEVDENNFTIDVDPTDEGARFNDVRLRSVIDTSNNGMIIVPEKGANVLIGIIGNNDNANYLISTDKIRKIIIETATGTKMVIATNGSVEFNDGSNGGLTITPKLVAELTKTNQVVQAIQNALLTWTPVTQDGGAALKAIASATLNSLQVGDFSQIENGKVKH